MYLLGDTVCIKHNTEQKEGKGPMEWASAGSEILTDKHIKNGRATSFIEFTG